MYIIRGGHFGHLASYPTIQNLLPSSSLPLTPVPENVDHPSWLPRPAEPVRRVRPPIPADHEPLLLSRPLLLPRPQLLLLGKPFSHRRLPILRRQRSGGRGWVRHRDHAQARIGAGAGEEAARCEGGRDRREELAPHHKDHHFMSIICIKWLRLLLYFMNEMHVLSVR